MTSTNSRRDFLKQLSALSGSAATLPLMGGLLSMGEAAAQTVSTCSSSADYKALVCVFLAGGNDSYNTVMYNDASATRYAAVRPNIRSDAGMLPLAGNQSKVALNAALGSLVTPYKEGRVSIVANVGPVVKPTKRNAGGNGFTVATVNADASQTVPDKLFSHNDQTSIWQTRELEGTQGSGGWGARLLLDSAETSKYASVGVDNAPGFTSYWLPGASTGVVTFGASGTEGALMPASPLGDGTMSATQLGSIIRNGPTSSRPSGKKHVFEVDYLRQSASALASWQDLIVGSHLIPLSAGAQAIVDAASKVNVPYGVNLFRQESNELATQLAMVYRFISSRDQTCVKRQVFYVQLNGFDTHSAQAITQQALLIKLNAALAMFDQLLALDMNAQGKSSRDRVTTFTASEFGRKLNENGDGTDHGWGGHHFVMGGAQINGYRAASGTVAERSGIYGKMPDLTKFDATTGLYPDEQLLPDGTMIPTFALDQFGWQLGSWFGLSATQLDNIFPYNKNFASTGINVGFLNPAA